MNKSLATNLVSLAVVLLALYLQNEIIYSIGVFSLAGAVTNWLAIHMLFEKVPFLYGSGVVPARFAEFKSGIKIMIMEQFFSAENIEKFLKDTDAIAELRLRPIIEKVDFEPTFDGLIEVIQQSSFGAMLEMVGGVAALEPIREPFIKKIQQSIIDTTESEQFKKLLATELHEVVSVAEMIAKVEHILEQRLQELTPMLVKDIVQKMIRQHLGWLVVWGGVFGGLIGAAAVFFG
ncbi:MAG: hypothetical protein OFPII_07280 [Osedax symbiont Rs1]|nr:MAG: hypothetical protein OFPII_07280 [Osedax symbiont Rs1]